MWHCFGILHASILAQAGGKNKPLIGFWQRTCRHGTQRGEPQPNIRLERERLAKRTQEGRKMEAKIYKEEIFVPPFF
jgi:hypothetical protein